VKNYELRGESVNYVNCHIQDIPENGADLKHFFYVHTYILKWITFVKFKWALKWTRANDPNLIEYTRLKDTNQQNFREKLYKEFITPENRDYISILSLENQLVIFGKEIKLFNLTGFQLGPGLVQLFLDSKLFQTMFR